MLVSQARRFGEFLVERQVLSRDDLESCRSRKPSERASRCPVVLLQPGSSARRT